MNGIKISIEINCESIINHLSQPIRGENERATDTRACRWNQAGPTEPCEGSDSPWKPVCARIGKELRKCAKEVWSVEENLYFDANAT